MRSIPAALLAASVVQVGAGQPASVHTLAQRDRWLTPLEPSSVSISADGRLVAFTSYARLAPADTNNRRDIYVVDRVDGHVTLESVTVGGLAAVADSDHPRLSADGRFLVYETVLPDSATIAQVQIVLRDRREGTVRLVSAGPGGQPANGLSADPDISADGYFVVFMSQATNLTSGIDANGSGQDIYAFEVQTGTVTLISVHADGAQRSSGGSAAPSVSGDGRYVAFVSMANLDGTGPSAAGGRSPPSVYVRDRLRSVTRRISAARGGRAPDGPSWMPSISADGRFVAFVSDATNLTAGDRNRSADVFLADVQTGSISLISRGGAGGSANGPSGNPAISADGRFVAFQSDASDLLCVRRCTPATEDINLLWDVFLIDRVSGAITRVSGESAAGWMEPSIGAALSARGEVVVFSSRHPIDATDTQNDYDLFICAWRSRTAVGSVPGERPNSLDHRHEPHAFPHRDVLTEDPLDDPGVHRGYVRGG